MSMCVPVRPSPLTHTLYAQLSVCGRVTRVGCAHISHTSVLATSSPRFKTRLDGTMQSQPCTAHLHAQQNRRATFGVSTDMIPTRRAMRRPPQREHSPATPPCFRNRFQRYWLCASVVGEATSAGVSDEKHAARRGELLEKHAA